MQLMKSIQMKANGTSGKQSIFIWAAELLKYEYRPYWADYWKQRCVDHDGENQYLIVDET